MQKIIEMLKMMASAQDKFELKIMKKALIYLRKLGL